MACSMHRSIIFLRPKCTLWACSCYVLCARSRSPSICTCSGGPSGRSGPWVRSGLWIRSGGGPCRRRSASGTRRCSSSGSTTVHSRSRGPSIRRGTGSRSRTRRVFQTWKLQCFMMTSSNGNIFGVTGPLRGESTDHRWIPLTKAVMRSFDLGLSKRLSRQWRRRWFETPLRSLWRHCNDKSGLKNPIILHLSHILQIHHWAQMCTNFCGECGTWDRCIASFVRMVYYNDITMCDVMLNQDMSHDDVIKWKLFPRYLLALCTGISPVTGEFPAQRTSKSERSFHLMTSSCIMRLSGPVMH